MKAFCNVALLLALVSCTSAQVPGTPAGSPQAVTLPLFTLNISPLSQASVQTVGTPGSTQYFYWAVSQYLIGPSFPVLVAVEPNSNGTLSVSNYNQIFPNWTVVTGIQSIDLLRTTSSLQPTGACNCAVATGITPGSTVNDQSNSLNSYTVASSIPVGNLTYTITNEVVGAGASHLILRQNGTFIGDITWGSGAGQEFNCADITAFGTVNACLDAAKAYLGNGNAGNDKAAYIRFPTGYLSIANAPYTLASGMNIIGVPPRVEYVAGTSADLNMIPNGGTWFDCGGHACFTGSQLRGTSMVGVGFRNYCTAGTAGCSVFTFGSNGSPGVDGIAWSYFFDLIAIGSTTCCKTDMAWVFYNSQHINGQFMTAFDVNVGLNLISQGLEAPMNSVFSDVYTYTYAKSVANGNNGEPGLWLQCLQDSGGNNSGLAFITLVRPQVNSYNGDNTGYNVILNGSNGNCPVQNVDLEDLDAEGPQLDQVFFNGTSSHNFLRYQGYSGSPSGPTTTVELASGANFNVIESLDNNAAVKIDTGGNGNNTFRGTFASFTDTGGNRRGQWYLAPSSGFQLFSDSGWFAQGLTFGNFASGVLAAEYDGTAAAPVYTNSTGKEGMFLDHNGHLTEFSCNGTECGAFGAAVGSVPGNWAIATLAASTGTNLCNNTAVFASFNTIAGCTSLRKYKSHIQTLGLSLPEVMKLRPVSYLSKTSHRREIGFIAEEIETIDARNSTYDKEGKLQGVDYGHMVALLTKAIQEQQVEIENLKAAIDRGHQ